MLRLLGVIAALLVAGGGAAAASARPHVETRHGAVVYVDAKGVKTTVVPRAGRNPVLSPDGRMIALIRTDDAKGGGSALWLYDVRAHRLRRLLASHPTDDNETNLRDLNSPAFSGDGRTVYVLSAAWVTSDALFRVNVATGAHAFVAPSNLVLVVRDGPHAGDLIVSQHSYRAAGGSYEQLALLHPNGKQVQLIPGDMGSEEDARAWLKANG